MPALPKGADICGVGIDLESVSRLKTAVERSGETFLEKVFSPAEIELCRSRGAHVWESFAARWAAKEAFAKALGTGIGGEVSMVDLSVLEGTHSEPVAEISLHGKEAMTKISASRAFVSLSHTKEFATAIVLLTR